MDSWGSNDPLSAAVIGAAIEVHKQLGPGLLESAYAECLCHELSLRGISFLREFPLPIHYKGIKLDCGYRLDLVVENELVVELKTVRELLPMHEAQLLSYLRLGAYGRGLLINFRVPLLKLGIKRHAHSATSLKFDSAPQRLCGLILSSKAIN